MTQPIKTAAGVLAEFAKDGSDRLPVTVLPLSAALPTLDSAGSFVLLDRTAIQQAELQTLAESDARWRAPQFRGRVQMIDARGSTGLRGR